MDEDERNNRQRSRCTISPADNILLGATAIKRYLRIRSWATLYRLIELYGLPAIKRPDGKWMSSVTAIDEWLFLASEADANNRPYLRGTNERLDRATERIAKRRAFWSIHGAARATDATERAAELDSGGHPHSDAEVQPDSLSGPPVGLAGTGPNSR